MTAEQLHYSPKSIVEEEIKRSLGSGQESSRRKRTISLDNSSLDYPLAFVHYKSESYPQTLRRLGSYHVFLRDDRYTYPGVPYNYCRLPFNAMSDAPFTLLLFAEFGPPSFSFSNESDRAAAVASFSIGNHKDPPRRVLEIEQLQSGFKDRDKDSFNTYLSFIRYQELFNHMIEQLAWRLRFTCNLPFDFVTFPTNALPADRQRATSQLGYHNHSSADYEAKIAEIVNTRIQRALQKGYTQKLVVSANSKNSGEHLSFGKPVERITPDRKLQAVFNKLAKK